MTCPATVAAGVPTTQQVASSHVLRHARFFASYDRTDPGAPHVYPEPLHVGDPGGGGGRQHVLALQPMSLTQACAAGSGRFWYRHVVALTNESHVKPPDAVQSDRFTQHSSSVQPVCESQ